MNEIAKPNYEQLITKIGSTLAEGKSRVAAAINTALVQSYWTIGQHIVEYEQQGVPKLHDTVMRYRTDEPISQLLFRRGEHRG